MKHLEYASLFPMMPDVEINTLAADIKASGQRKAISTLDGEILDRSGDSRRGSKGAVRLRERGGLHDGHCKGRVKPAGGPVSDRETGVARDLHDQKLTGYRKTPFLKPKVTRPDC